MTVARRRIWEAMQDKGRMLQHDAGAPQVPSTMGFSQKTGGAGVPAILIVEDEPKILELYVSSIQDDVKLNEFELLTAGNESDAVQLFRENKSRIMAVVTDRTLSDDTGDFKDTEAGDKLIRHIRAIEEEAGNVDSSSRLGVGVLMISATIPVDKSSIGADEFQKKPLGSEDLVDGVKRMIALTERRRPQTLRQ